MPSRSNRSKAAMTAASSVTSKRAWWTRLPGSLHGRGRRGEAPLVRPVEHDGGTGGGEPLGHGAAEAARGAGDEGGAPFEREELG